jgi:NAD(P)-dependent dehydrogenase (short-subunit alcohol dehydrogenase family)
MPRVLVTGANRGLGLEFARQYARDGWCVIACCRRPHLAEELAEIRGDVHIHELAVDKPAEVEALATKLKPMAIDVLINNAGIAGHDRAAQDVDPTEWANVMRVNALSPLLMARAFLPHLKQGEQKKLITITSLMGSIADNGSGGAYTYRASKAAVNMTMQSLSIEYRPHRIIVALLNPGWVRTDMGGSSAPLETATSIAGMRDLIAGFTPAHSGRFFHYDGRELPW